MNSTPTTDWTPRNFRLQPLIASSAFAIAALCVSIFLLVTMGGAVFAAPVTLPALVLITRFHAGWKRTAATVAAALTVAEVAWALTYVVAEAAKPWIWLIPLVAAMATVALIRRRWVGKTFRPGDLD